MSILDTIKALFCSNPNVANTSNEQETQVAQSEEVVVKEPSPTPIPVPAVTTQLQVPEDSTLKRHFLSKLKADIEAGMPPRPTESTLQRHYDSTVQAKLNDLLG